MLARFLQGAQHLLLVRLIVHVDKVDDDDAAEITQSQLARYCLCCLQIGAKHRVLEAIGAQETAGVHVNRGHRLGLLDHQITARAQRHARRQRPGQLVFHPVALKQRAALLIEVHALHELGQKVAHEILHPLVGFEVIDTDMLKPRPGQIANHPDVHRQFLINQRGSGDLPLLLQHLVPQPRQDPHIGLDRSIVRAFRRRARDQPHTNTQPLAHAGNQPAQPIALGFILDALGNADVVVEWHQHQVPRGDGQRRRQPGALAGNGILGDLHHQLLALVQQIADIGRPVRA